VYFASSCQIILIFSLLPGLNLPCSPDVGCTDSRADCTAEGFCECQAGYFDSNGATVGGTCGGEETVC